jgi:hypothetical protein
MTDVRLVCVGGAQGELNGALKGPFLEEQRTRHKPNAKEHKPALLVSYVYLKGFVEKLHLYSYRDWALDSGAFSAYNSGTAVNLQAYIDTCKRMQAAQNGLGDIFSLDVIGDWRAGIRNCEKMWSQGIAAIPTYHVGEPEALLRGLARDYPKIALGGSVGYRNKYNWADQCFSRVWPAKIHGLGFGSERSIMAVPWHSTDASSWELRPCRFGQWKVYGKLPVRGSSHNLKAEVEWYLRLEQRARHRWAKEMAELEAMPSKAPARQQF